MGAHIISEKRIISLPLMLAISAKAMLSALKDMVIKTMPNGILSLLICETLLVSQLDNQLLFFGSWSHLSF
jgi:hypothetical protein